MANVLITVDQFSRLLSLLNNTKLQTTNPPLWQFLKNFLEDVLQLNKNVAGAIADITPAPVPNPSTSNTGPVFFPEGGSEGIDGFSIPGQTGPTGPTGQSGPIGNQGIPGIDGQNGFDGFSIPGSIGPQGTQGIQGIQGTPGIPGSEGDPGYDPFMVGMPPSQPTEIVLPTNAIAFGVNGGIGSNVADFYWDNVNKRLALQLPVGVAPNATVTAYATGSPFIGTRISANGNANAVTLRKARGATLATPTKVLNGDAMGAFASQGYEEVTPSYRQTGIFQFQALEDFTNVAAGTRLDISLAPAGSVTPVTVYLLTPVSLALFQNSATPVGGTAGLGVSLGSTANFGVFFGSGLPTLSAAKGSLYLRSDGSTVNDRIYVNTNGTTGWTAVLTVI